MTNNDYEIYDNFNPNTDNYEFKTQSSRILKGDAEEETENNEEVKTTKAGFRHTIKEILNSRAFHIIIIVLVVLDCLFVCGELLIDYLEIYLTSSNHHTDNKKFLEHMPADFYSLDQNSTTNHTNSVSEHYLNHNLLEFLKVLENIFKYGSITILGIFIIEIVLKIIFAPKNFCKPLEIFDAIIVIIGFTLNIVLLHLHVVIHSLSGIITVLRYFIFLYIFFFYFNI